MPTIILTDDEVQFLQDVLIDARCGFTDVIDETDKGEQNHTAAVTALAVIGTLLSKLEG